MAGWVSFKIGRPGYEYTFDVNPVGMSIDEGPVDVTHRNLKGHLKKSIIKVSVPTIRINSDYLLKTQRDQFASLVGINDTFLSFITRDDWQKQYEWCMPATVSTLYLQESSATKLGAALVAAGQPGSITVTAVHDNPGGTGTNFYTGGTYSNATRLVTLGTPLSSAVNPVYVTYTYTGWLVNLRRFSHRVQGGWIDRFQYDFELVGV